MSQQIIHMTPEDRRVLKSLLVAVMALQVMTPFLHSGVAVLLPAMGKTFGCSAAQLGLVSTVCCMALSVFSLASGRAGDKWGRRRVCLGSMLILAPISLAISLAPPQH